jgi:hypothetical protein
LTIGGVSQVGDVSLAFYDSHPRSVLGQLNDALGHVSNLKDRGLPVGVLMALIAGALLAIPLLAVLALGSSLRTDDAEDRAAPRSPRSR